MNINAWIGRTETDSDVVTATPYAGLSAVLDRSPARPPAGTPLPPLWHWLYFLPLHGTSDIGPDGHARRGDFLPPVPLPRRMWAGSRFLFRTPLRVGDIIDRTSTIEEVAPKEGKSGPLVFVKVRHEVRRDEVQEPALVEWHDIVYRAAPRSGQVESPARPAPGHATWMREWKADDVLLFRYSALTFNSHRIHYDRRYATEVEGYPGLVVHGPLLATLLLDLVHRERPDAKITGYEFRAMRPIFDLHPFHVCGEPQPGGATVRLWVRDHEGALAMDATAQIEAGRAKVPG
jgi:3-methylfumaryl-CoA hydratase